MTPIVLGAGGQLSIELERMGLSCAGLDVLDFTQPDAVATWAESAHADVFINAAAYTAVDKAESEEDVATLINATSVARVADVAAKRGIPLVHVSTDYVFEGSGEKPWKPEDPTGPLGAYGRTKLAGEEAIRAAGGSHAILRTSWVVSAHGANFVKTMLRLGAERDRLTIVADQIGGPTPAKALAEVCVAAAKALSGAPSKSGTYHFSGAPDTSWADFAREIFRQSGTACEVADIPTTDYPTPAARPLNSRMDCSATESAFGVPRPDWRVHLSEILKELRS